MNRLLWIFKKSIPILVALIGGYLMHLGGVNDCSNCMNIFEAIDRNIGNSPYMLMGLILTIISIGWVITLIFIAFYNTLK